MTTSEPTTGEIVRALRCVAEAIECKDCRYKYPVGNVILCDHEQMNGNAADRIESQEQTIAALTARAEKAEAREKAIIESLRDRCEFCVGYELEENDDPCNTCYNARTFEPDDIPRTKNWTWCGLPQEGEGV